MIFFELFKTLYLKDIQLTPNEKELMTFDNIKVESHGHGPRSTLFPGCKIIITNMRIIIAQKMLWRKNYKVHYFIWFENKINVDVIEKGMLNLFIDKRKIEQQGDTLEIIPSDTAFITLLEIKKAPVELKKNILELCQRN